MAYNDAIRQQIEILLRTGGEGDVVELRDLIAQLNAELAKLEDQQKETGDASGRMAQQIAEADEQIVRAHAYARIQAEELTRAHDAAGGRAEWLARQDIELASALQGLAIAEQTAATATVTHIAAAVRMTPEMEAQNRRVGAMSRGFLELSRGIEDFAVAGPLGVLNNIPGVAYDIGVAMGKSAMPPRTCSITTGTR